jgi:hypothetical protein
MAAMLGVASAHGSEIVLQPRKGGKGIAIADVIYLCETDALKTAGVLGKAKLLTLPADIEMPDWQRGFWLGAEKDRKTPPRVKMYVLRVFSERISRKSIQGNEILGSLAFAPGYRATMHGMDAEQATELDRLAG